MATRRGSKAPVEEEPAPQELGEAQYAYVRQLPEDQKQAAQAEIARFVRWLGPERGLGSIGPPEIGEYSDLISAKGTTPDAAERLGTVKIFLAHLKKKGYIEVNLAQHLRLRKGRSSAVRRSMALGQQVVRLTKAGHAELERKLELLQVERIRMTEAIHTAAQDKDVRENAPLEAAREEQGRVMARILEIQATLNSSVVIDAATTEAAGDRVALGSKVSLKDMANGKVVECQLVEPNESSPLSGKISSASPVGGAILGRSPGEEVTVETPGGTQVYQIIDTT